MVCTFLVLFVFINADVFAQESFKDSSLDESGRAKSVQTYLPLPHDAVERIYNEKKDAHRCAIAKRRDMPFCLQSAEGPLPFYGHPADAQLGFLRSDYFAALQFDRPEIQRTTEEMRKTAVKVRYTDPTSALELLYNSGWKMGDPESIKMFVDLLTELQSSGSEYIVEDSNLISVLQTYPKTIRDVIRSIKSSRESVEYRRRKSSSESFGTGSLDESSDSERTSGDDTAALMGTYEKGGLKQRRVKVVHKSAK